MRAYILGRLVSTMPVLFGVSIVIFLLMKLIPGDAAQVLAGPSATHDEVELIREDLGLNEPLHVQYRSEEHTSELQSQSNLVCRLLLEKKKTHYNIPYHQKSPSLPIL